MPVSGPIDLTGQVAIVTGGARAIGRATCNSLARAGADIVVADILPLDDVLADIKKYNRRAVGIKLDVTNPDEVKQAISRAMEEFGRIDILITNAGVMGKTGIPIQDITLVSWDFHLNVNLKGTFLFVQAVWPIMEKQKWGKIVCMGSIAGRIGGVLAGPDYSATKGGIHAMVKMLAMRGAKSGIYVNAIAPGPIQTPMTANEGYKAEMTPLGRLGEPVDIAEPALFLASAASNFITGIVLDVSAGMVRH